MIEFMVIEVGLAVFNGLGSHKFRVAPQRGDIITLDREGTGHAFEVVAVIHPLEPAATAGDLLLRHIGEHAEFLSKFTPGDSLPAAFGKHGN